MFNMDEIREKWEELGFLKDLPEHLKNVVAFKFETLTICILDNDDYIDNVTLTNTVIPIVYRIYKEGSSIGEVKNFIMQLDEWFIENRQMISDLNLIYSIDVEYHLCTLFVEHWKSEKRIEPLKWVNKHKL
tara:strand:+ start:7366 stop:7758 length:393 start_codon:yes stop_codon:yes gene_type:complete